MTMTRQVEKILVVDDDPAVLDLIAQQVLIPQGYQVATASDGNTAMQMALKLQPDLVITSLNLPGFSGRDLLAALRTQGVLCTIIATGPKGEETKALQAFRLGAKDYLTKPLREAELVATIDHALEDVRLRREREQLEKRLKTANEQLEKRVKELTTLFGIGKAVTGITNLTHLFGRLLEGALFVTEGELAWLLLVDDATQQLILRAGKNLPNLSSLKLNQPWDDGISGLLMQSGEGITLHGIALEKLRVGQVAKAAVVMPIKSKDQVMGILGVGNKTGKPFTERDQAMLSAVADYASVTLVNARLFQSLEAKARSLQQANDEMAKGTRQKDDVLGSLGRELRGPLLQARTSLDSLAKGDLGALPSPHMGALRAGLERLDFIQRLVDDLAIVGEMRAPTLRPINLSELARQAAGRLSVEARQIGLTLTTELTNEPHQIAADAAMISRALDNLLLNALKFAPQGSQIVVRVQPGDDNTLVASVTDHGPGLPADKAPRIWERFLSVESPGSRKAINTGLGLAVVKQIIEAHGGRVWVESESGKGSTFFFALRRL
jgi:signal transduction histidine kinase/CheY-like chemotaxis protein